MRVFIAVELPDEVKKKIVGIIDTLSKNTTGVKWVEEKNLHITLKFLGWVEDQSIDKVIELIEKVSGEHKIFNAKFEGLGSFPPGRKPRVIWVGTSKGDKELKNLALSIEKALTQVGFEKEEREFASHITIGRVKEPKMLGGLIKEIEENKDFFAGETVVENVAVMKSTLTPKGPIYEVVKRIKLA